MATAALTAWKNKYETALKATRRVREKAGETIEGLMNAGVCAGTGFALGALAGTLKDPAQWVVAGVPIPLWIAAGSHVAAFAGIGRGMDTHLRAVGNGALAVHAFGMGRKLIESRKTESSGEKISGEESPPLLGSARKGSGITEADLRAMAL